MSVPSTTGERRVFTLQEAQELLPLVKKLTHDTVMRVSELVSEIEEIPEDDPEFEECRSEIESTIQNWADHLEKLGCEIKGLWLVDFDNGQGYYCWTYPEDEIDHFHGYDENFADRTLIC